MSKDDQPRRRRFIIAFPFSSICRSQSSVDVVFDTTARRAGKKPHHQGSGTAGGGAPGKKVDESLVARLLKGFKNLSQIFAVYDDDEEDEEEEREMVIGLPTDVKHVAHMGWDGSTSTTTSLRSWNNARAAPQQQPAAVPPLPALSMRQFELAMAAQAVAATDDTTVGHRRHS